MYEEPYRVTRHNTGYYGDLRLVSLLDLFQDIAEEHATRLGLGIDWMHETGLLWLLARYRIKVQRFPNVGETLRARTWPVAFQRLYAIREFSVLDASDKLVATASSAWLMTNREFRPVRPAEHAAGKVPFEPRLYPDDALMTPLPELDLEDANELEQEHFKVRLHDIDVIRHVNNTHYLRWALEAVPQSVSTQARPREVAVDFRGMAFLGEVVQSSCKRIEGEPGQRQVYLHGLRRESDNRELTRVRTAWEPYSGTSYSHAHAHAGHEK